jgi:hypothetical protein
VWRRRRNSTSSTSGGWQKCGLSPKTLTNIYRYTIESILSGCITAWYGNCTAYNHKAFQRVVRSAQHITRGQSTCPPVHTASNQKARSVKVHQSWEIEKRLLSQGHQNVKQPHSHWHREEAAYLQTWCHRPH